ncbi:MAG: hypothetical protein JJE41_15485 [Candidatus Heimdallarchaeota archaeon]|nr:hypothetical protein [Candidatus Heimdallarchaeota archaeon]
MKSQDKYLQDLTNIFNEFLETLDDRPLQEYLVKNSRLPSPRGNLELAYCLYDLTLTFNEEKKDDLWKLFSKLSQISAGTAPVNDPKEFLSFCGIFGIGAIANNYHSYLSESLKILKKASSDGRWRMREGTAHVLTKLIKTYQGKVIDRIFPWIKEKNWLLIRAAAAAFADPKLLKDKKLANTAFELHLELIDLILKEKDRRSIEFRAARKGFAYTFSVVVAALPDKGFEFLESLTLIDDNDIRWILKQNLRKNRLKNRFPEKVEYLLLQLK